MECLHSIFVSTRHGSIIKAGVKCKGKNKFNTKIFTSTSNFTSSPDKSK